MAFDGQCFSHVPQKMQLLLSGTGLSVINCLILDVNFCGPNKRDFVPGSLNSSGPGGKSPITVNLSGSIFKRTAMRLVGRIMGSSPIKEQIEKSIIAGLFDAAMTPSCIGLPLTPGPSPCKPTTPSRMEISGDTNLHMRQRSSAKAS